ncbi:MAG: TraB/GumN family protein [Gammaproteobacteria bacterium]|nr:TraB/GumN family protein [Gammaproteobacteria bacterium]
MLKISRRAIFLLPVLLLLVSCGILPRNELASDTGLLWRVEGKGIPVSYLFGTMHSEDPRVLALSSEVEFAFNSASSLVLEINFSDESRQYAVTSMFFQDGTRLSDLLSATVYEQTLNLMSVRGLDEVRVSRMKPWAAFTLMNMPESKTGIYLDISLYQRALGDGKEVLGLETIQEQISTFDDMDMSTQVQLLEGSLGKAKDFEKALQDTVERYLSRDLNRLSELNEEFLEEMSPELAHTFRRRLIDDRNQRMFSRLISLLPNQKYFVAVGALHLPGDTGLIAQLRDAGFQVTPVY